MTETSADTAQAANANEARCVSCGAKVFEHSRNCHACGEDVGFPNVRLAGHVQETTELERRVEEARVSAAARGTLAKLELFGAAVDQSHAVIARSFGVIHDLLSSDRNLYTTYHLQLEAQARAPEQNLFDRVRTQFEAAIAPNFHREIRYAALTLDRRWLKSFGHYAMILKDKFIERRASLFEENPYVFVRRHHILLTDPLPVGYRAVWSRRSELAMAKLHMQIQGDTLPEQFAGLVLQERGTTGEDDYIEVHIYGGFNRDAIERVVGPRPKTREDRLDWERLKRRMAALDCVVEEVP